MEYYSAVKRYLPINPTAWMTFQKVMLRTQETRYCMVCLYEISRESKAIKTESRLVGVWGGNRN